SGVAQTSDSQEVSAACQASTGNTRRVLRSEICAMRDLRTATIIPRPAAEKTLLPVILGAAAGEVGGAAPGAAAPGGGRRKLGPRGQESLIAAPHERNSRQGHQGTAAG